MYTFTHLCRDGHPQIGHSTDDEQCPVCVVRAENAKLRELVRSILRRGAVPQNKLRLLADWFDLYDRKTGNSNKEVQHDLRELADALDEARAALGEDRE